MTVEAIFRTRVLAMLRRTLLVAAQTARADYRPLLVDAVAVGAILFGVHLDRSHLTLLPRMAADARGGNAVGRKNVAAEAVRLLSRRAGVRACRFLSMAAHTNLGSRVLESVVFVIVTVTAYSLPRSDVRSVPGAYPVLGPRRRHEARRRPVCAARAHRDAHRDRCDDEHRNRKEDHREELPLQTHRPTPWQRRQGRSWCMSRVLEKPFPCGLPPGPPTL
jgi:hypothetical protein